MHTGTSDRTKQHCINSIVSSKVLSKDNFMDKSAKRQFLKTGKQCVLTFDEVETISGVCSFPDFTPGQPTFKPISRHLPPQQRQPAVVQATTPRWSAPRSSAASAAAPRWQHQSGARTPGQSQAGWRHQQPGPSNTASAPAPQWRQLAAAPSHTYTRSVTNATSVCSVPPPVKHVMG